MSKPGPTSSWISKTRPLGSYTQYSILTRGEGPWRIGSAFDFGSKGPEFESRLVHQNTVIH